MIIRYLGHAFFTLTLENGTTIAMDPYGEFYQYRLVLSALEFHIRSI